MSYIGLQNYRKVSNIYIYTINIWFLLFMHVSRFSWHLVQTKIVYQRRCSKSLETLVWRLLNSSDSTILKFDRVLPEIDQSGGSRHGGNADQQGLWVDLTLTWIMSTPMNMSLIACWVLPLVPIFFVFRLYYD